MYCPGNLRWYEERQITHQHLEMLQRLPERIPVYPSRLFNKEMEKVRWACEHFVKVREDDDTTVSFAAHKEIAVDLCISGFESWIRVNFATGAHFRTRDGVHYKKGS